MLRYAFQPIVDSSCYQNMYIHITLPSESQDVDTKFSKYIQPIPWISKHSKKESITKGKLVESITSKTGSGTFNMLNIGTCGRQLPRYIIIHVYALVNSSDDVGAKRLTRNTSSLDICSTKLAERRIETFLCRIRATNRFQVWVSEFAAFAIDWQKSQFEPPQTCMDGLSLKYLEKKWFQWALYSNQFYYNVGLSKFTDNYERTDNISFLSTELSPNLPGELYFLCFHRKIHNQIDKLYSKNPGIVSIEHKHWSYHTSWALSRLNINNEKSVWSKCLELTPKEWIGFFKNIKNRTAAKIKFKAQWPTLSTKANLLLNFTLEILNEVIAWPARCQTYCSDTKHTCTTETSNLTLDSTNLHARQLHKNKSALSISQLVSLKKNCYSKRHHFKAIEQMGDTFDGARIALRGDDCESFTMSNYMLYQQFSRWYNQYISQFGMHSMSPLLELMGIIASQYYEFVFTTGTIDMSPELQRYKTEDYPHTIEEEILASCEDNTYDPSKHSSREQKKDLLCPIYGLLLPKTWLASHTWIDKNTALHSDLTNLPLAVIEGTENSFCLQMPTLAPVLLHNTIQQDQQFGIEDVFPTCLQQIMKDKTPISTTLEFNGYFRNCCLIAPGETYERTQGFAEFCLYTTETKDSVKRYAVPTKHLALSCSGKLDHIGLTAVVKNISFREKQKLISETIKISSSVQLFPTFDISSTTKVPYRERTDGSTKLCYCRSIDFVETQRQDGLQQQWKNTQSVISSRICKITSKFDIIQIQYRNDIPSDDQPETILKRRVRKE